MLNLGIEDKYDIIIEAKGGGVVGQAEAIMRFKILIIFVNCFYKYFIKDSFYFFKLAISRVIYGLVNKESGNKLKLQGFLSRDCRCKERKSMNTNYNLCILLKVKYCFNRFFLILL